MGNALKTLQAELANEIAKAVQSSWVAANSRLVQTEISDAAEYSPEMARKFGDAVNRILEDEVWLQVDAVVLETTVAVAEAATKRLQK